MHGGINELAGGGSMRLYLYRNSGAACNKKHFSLVVVMYYSRRGRVLRLKTDPYFNYYITAQLNVY